jgi:predicted small secreted protein
MKTALIALAASATALAGCATGATGPTSYR